NAELLGGGAGLLGPPEDGAALGRLAAGLLDDPVRRGLLGAAGRERARRFSLEEVAARYEAVYAELAAAPAQGLRSAGARSPAGRRSPGAPRAGSSPGTAGGAPPGRADRR